MENRMPFGFVAEEDQVKSYIVQKYETEVFSNKNEWEQQNRKIYVDQLGTQEFWEKIAECIERDRKAKAEYKLIKNDFRCPVSSVARLVEELVCRDIVEEEMILLMDQRVYRRLVYDVALQYRDIGEHHEAMTARQALLFDGAYIRVGFSKFLPTFQLNLDGCAELQCIQLVAVTSGQVEVDLPDWCRSGRYGS